MRSTYLSAVAALALLAFGHAAHADNDFGLGIKAGTLGAGLEGTWRPLPYLDIRIGANMYDFEDSGSQAGVNYNAELNLESYYGTLNFRFPMSPMRVTVGAFGNGNELNMVSMDSTFVTIGGDIYPSDAVGTLTSTTSFAGTAPYLGVGFDFSLFRKVGMNLDFGVLWQGEPEVTLLADGPLASDPGFQSSLEAERQELFEEVKDFKAWPVLSLGFVVNF